MMQFLMLVQAVGGNAALALLLTVGTNLVGIFTMPFVLCWALGAGNSAVSLAPGPLLRSLMRTILLPLLIGAAARAFIPGALTQLVSTANTERVQTEVGLLCNGLPKF